MFLHLPVSILLYITPIERVGLGFYYYDLFCILFWNSGDVSCLDGSLMCMHDSPGRAKFAWPRYLKGGTNCWINIKQKIRLCNNVQWNASCPDHTTSVGYWLIRT